MTYCLIIAPPGSELAHKLARWPQPSVEAVQLLPDYGSLTPSDAKSASHCKTLP